ncbi:hypothetical protein [Pyrobaculum neutrophilum]|uniref:Uncharacterized protein n=1 Tax=Pyrobaculum neutrophilum (strain DSM 2338 / JCM 9278 / NBRC 100436 / V24Sta) TaxID=444157 RepID=B1YCC1_PYRNV|nr:hypothetical protein [Pyrobaculum neutrophilum]ACB39434.1 hypothetical protein Tneu_0487 [Pyrobaculum neutrophilum V24Sta]
MSGSKYDILAIVVNYNSNHILPIEKLLLKTLDRLSDLKSLKLVLIDNGSTDGSLQELEKEIKELKLDDAVLTAPGLALGAYSAAMYLTGVKTYVKALAATALTAAGINTILIALLALYLKRMEYRITRIMRLSTRKICTTP